MARYTQCEMEDMIEILQNYARRDSDASPGLHLLEQEMERLLAPLAEMTSVLKALLTARWRLGGIHKLVEELRRCHESFYATQLPFEGNTMFVTEQLVSPFIPPFSGPTLRANTREEAERRAALLGLKVVGHT